MKRAVIGVLLAAVAVCVGAQAWRVFDSEGAVGVITTGMESAPPSLLGLYRLKPGGNYAITIEWRRFLTEKKTIRVGYGFGRAPTAWGKWTVHNHTMVLLANAPEVEALIRKLVDHDGGFWVTVIADHGPISDWFSLYGDGGREAVESVPWFLD